MLMVKKIHNSKYSCRMYLINNPRKLTLLDILQLYPRRTLNMLLALKPFLGKFSLMSHQLVNFALPLPRLPPLLPPFLSQSHKPYHQHFSVPAEMNWTSTATHRMHRHKKTWLKVVEPWSKLWTCSHRYHTMHWKALGRHRSYGKASSVY